MALWQNFNGMIPVPLTMYCESSMTTAVGLTVFW